MPQATMLAGATALALLFAASSAAAQDYYVSAHGGIAMLDDSDNSGAFSSDFTTGEGTTIPAGTVLPSGTGVGWTTEFDSGTSFGVATGRSYGSWRGEVEVAFQNNDVDTHTNVQAGGIALGGEDAGVLITGSDNLGVTVADLVADGQGSVEATYLMANLYYDFAMGGFTPYVGAGVGAAFVDVDYSPSGVGIVSDDDTVFAYQVLAGASFDLTENWAIFGQYRYRASEDVSTDVSLFDATLDVENRSSLFEAGVRLRF